MFSRFDTERDALVASELRLRIATEAAQLGIWEWKISTNEIIYSPRAREIFGFDADDYIDLDKLRAATHPDDLPRTSKQAKEALDSRVRRNTPYQYRILRSDTGEERWVLAHGEAIFTSEDEDAQALFYVGTIQDITDEKNRIDQLANGAAKLQLAMDSAGLALWEIDLTSDTITHSPELNRIFGLPDDAAPTTDELRAMYAPGVADQLAEEGQKAQADGRDEIKSEIRIIRPDGSERWVLMMAKVAPGSSAPGQRVIGALQDITERKGDEIALRNVAHEMRHRLKNTLSIIQAMTNQTLRRADTMQDARTKLSGRFAALAASTDLMFRERNDLRDEVNLVTVIAQALAPYRPEDAEPFVTSGPDAPVKAKTAMATAMVLHELATNAVKYGALSAETGTVELTWSLSECSVRFNWREKNGPTVREPESAGFGSALLTSMCVPGSLSVQYLSDGLQANFSIENTMPTS